MRDFLSRRSRSKALLYLILLNLHWQNADYIIMGQALTEQELELSLSATLNQVRNADSFHVFAYGSLVWKPDFDYKSKHIAKILGYRRSFCHLSPFARGTEERPGLVLALEPGNGCEGVLYELTISDHYDQLRGLWHRELRTGSYFPQWTQARKLNDPNNQGNLTTCLAFVVNPFHDQYVPALEPNQILEVIRNAKGHYGSNLDYFKNTLTSLRSLSIVDPELENIASRLGL